MKRALYLIAACSIALAPLVGCGFLDKRVDPQDPESATVGATIGQGVSEAAEALGGILPPPWGSVAAIAGVTAAGVLGYRKIKKSPEGKVLG